MGALLDDPAVVEHQHQIGPLGRAQPVGDRDQGPARGQPGQGRGQGLLGLGVHRGRGLVQHQQAGVGHLGPGQGHELALPHREPPAPLPHHRGQPVGQPVHPRPKPQLLDGGGRVAGGGAGPPEPDVLLDGGVEQETVLGDHPYPPAALVGGHLGQVHPADQHRAPGGVGQAGDQPGEGGLARAGLADHGHVGAAGHGHVDPVQHLGAGAVGEADIAELDGQRAGGEPAAGVGLGQLHRHVEHLQDLPPAGQRGLGAVEDLAELGHRGEQQPDQEHEGHQLAHAHPHGPGPPHPDPDGGEQRNRRDQVDDGEHDHEPDLGPELGPVLAVHRPVEAAPDRLGVPVGADHRGPAHRLAGEAHGVGHPVPHPRIGPELAALGPAQEGQQRQMQQHHQQGELPAIDGHHGQGPHDQGGIDDPGDGPPLDELGQGLDVAGDPGHQHAPAGAGVIGQAQAVDVLEGPHPQPEQHLLGRLDQADVGGAAGHYHHRGQDQGGQRQGPDHAGPVAGRAEHPVVEHELDQDGDNQLAPGGQHGHGRGDADPPPQLGADGQAPAQHLQGAGLAGGLGRQGVGGFGGGGGLGDGGGLGGGGGGRGGGLGAGAGRVEAGAGRVERVGHLRRPGPRRR